MSLKKNQVLVILGPTATGKTDKAILLAKKFNGELVSCDSRQVYKGLDIGTGKAPSGISNFQFPISKQEKYWEIDGMKIWMYDVSDPNIQYSVCEYVKDAEKVIEDIIKRDKLPIIVGGTGLYLKGLLEGFPDMGIPINESLREELGKLSLPELQDRLKSASIDRWNKLNNSDRQNPRRLLRSIEIILMNPYVIRSKKQEARVKNFNVLKIGLTAPREMLYQKVDLRVLSRINEGMIDEARNLHKGGLSLERMRKLGLEYGILADFLEDKIKDESTHDLTVGVSSHTRTSSAVSKPSALQPGFFRDKDGLVKILQGKIHSYVRRQLTWFKKMSGIEWFDVSSPVFSEELEKRVGKWYYNR